MQEINLIGKLSTGGSVPPVIDELSVTRNGTYTPGSGVDGFSPVIVDVPQHGVIESKTITENGTYTPGSGVDGFSPVVVNVPAGGNILTNCFNSSIAGSMGVNYSIEDFDISWDGGSNIVCTLSSISDISNYSNLRISFTTGTSYYNTIGAHVVRELYIGITETYITPGTMPNNVSWVSVYNTHDDNQSYTYTWDLTELTATAMYLYISANGWNVSNLKIELS